MMSSKNSGFTASDIERYHSGKMPARERHALEKAALDDPFLADALEGYAFTQTPVADLAAIRARLLQKQDTKKIITLYKKYRWLSAAAAFIILAGSGWLAFKTLSIEKNDYAVAPPKETQQEKTSGENPAVTAVPGSSANSTKINKTVPQNKVQPAPKENEADVESSTTRQNTAPVMLEAADGRNKVAYEEKNTETVARARNQPDVSITRNQNARTPAPNAPERIQAEIDAAQFFDEARDKVREDLWDATE